MLTSVSLASLLPLAVYGCSDWPRSSNWPAANAGAAPVGDEAPEFGWTLVPAQDGVDDEPGSVAAEALQPGHGTRLSGAFSGTGWDPTAVVEFAIEDSGPDTGPACHESSDFPPVVRGDWTGDVDWRVVSISEPGTLCSALRARDPAVAVDVLLYMLDSCGTPFAAVRDGESPLGWRVEGPANAWSVPVEPAPANTRIAVLAAAFTPQATDEVAYDWGLALISAGDACPELP